MHLYSALVYLCLDLLREFLQANIEEVSDIPKAVAEKENNCV